MTENYTDPYEAGKRLLKEAVIADGGLMGLFGLMRVGGPMVKETLERYTTLLTAAASPEDMERNREELNAQETAHGMEWVDARFMALAATEGLHADDVPALLTAVVLCETAFPGVPVEEITAEYPI